MSSSNEKRSLRRGLSKRADKVRSLLKRMGGRSGGNGVDSSLTASSSKASSTSNLSYYRSLLDENDSRSRRVSSNNSRLSVEGTINNHHPHHHGVFAAKQSGRLAGPSPPISPLPSPHNKPTTTSTSTSSYSLDQKCNSAFVDDLAIGVNSLTSLPSSSTTSSLSSREYRSCEEAEDFKEQLPIRNHNVAVVRMSHPSQEIQQQQTVLLSPHDKEKHQREKEEREREKKEHYPLPSLANVVVGTDDEPKRFLSLKDKQEVVLPSIDEKLKHLKGEGAAKIQDSLASVEIKLQEQCLSKTNAAAVDENEEPRRDTKFSSEQQQQLTQEELPATQNCDLLPPAAEGKPATTTTDAAEAPSTLQEKETASNISVPRLSSVPSNRKDDPPPVIVIVEDTNDKQPYDNRISKPRSLEKTAVQEQQPQPQPLSLIDKNVKQDLQQDEKQQQKKTRTTESDKATTPSFARAAQNVQVIESTFPSADDKVPPYVKNDGHDLQQEQQQQQQQQQLAFAQQKQSNAEVDGDMSIDPPVVSGKDEVMQLLTKKDDPVPAPERAAPQPQGPPPSEAPDAAVASTARATTQDKQASNNSDNKKDQLDDDQPAVKQDVDTPTIIGPLSTEDKDDDPSTMSTDTDCDYEKEEAPALTEEYQPILRTRPLSEEMSKRVAYFDKKHCGKITVLDTLSSLRGLGYYWVVAIPATFIMHLRLSPLTTPAYSSFKDLFCLPIYTDRIARALHTPEAPLVAQREKVQTWVQLYGHHHGTAGVRGLGFWDGFRALRAAERATHLRWWQIRLWTMHRLQWILTYTLLYDPSARMVTQPALEGLCNEATLSPSSSSD